MIRVDQNETFPILVSLLDESTGQYVSGKTVYYDIRDMVDNPLSPPVSGTLTESTFEPGIYRSSTSISAIGMFIIYATCSGFLTNTEEVVVNPESIYELTKQVKHYNISVEDVLRTNATPNASQTARNVPMNKTDYVVTKIKRDNDANWSTPTTTSGIVYAHYRNTAEDVPYLMGDNGL